MFTPLGQRQQERLGWLLVSLFNASDLKFFLGRHAAYREILDRLPGGGAPLATTTEETARLFVELGLVNAALFERLGDEMPGRQRDIVQVQQECLPEGHVPIPPSLSESPRRLLRLLAALQRPTTPVFLTRLARSADALPESFRVTSSELRGALDALEREALTVRFQSTTGQGQIQVKDRHVKSEPHEVVTLNAHVAELIREDLLTRGLIRVPGTLADAEPLVAWAHHLALAGKTGDALDIWRNLLNGWPHLGAQLGGWDLGNALVTTMCENDGGGQVYSQQVRLEASRFASALGRASERRRWLDQAVATEGPDTAAAHTEMGLEALDMAEMPRALHHFVQAIALPLSAETDLPSPALAAGWARWMMNGAELPTSELRDVATGTPRGIWGGILTARMLVHTDGAAARRLASECLERARETRLEDLKDRAAATLAESLVNENPALALRIANTLVPPDAEEHYSAEINVRVRWVRALVHADKPASLDLLERAADVARHAGQHLLHLQIRRDMAALRLSQRDPDAVRGALAMASSLAREAATAQRRCRWLAADAHHLRLRAALQLGDRDVALDAGEQAVDLRRELAHPGLPASEALYREAQTR